MTSRRLGRWPDVSEIHKLRKELGITQQELASASGVAQPVISRIEDGSICNPSYRVIQKVFGALDDKTHSTGKRGTLYRLPVASDLMNKHVVCVKPTDRVEHAWAIMKRKNYSQLPVIDERGRVVGGISERSLPSEDKEGILDKRVEEVMGDTFPIVGKDTKIPTLVSLLKREPAILVVGKGKLVGIVTAYDLMENAYRNELYLTNLHSWI